ncbi:NACHT domain-containing protein [Zavarzinella formosa]|uniref:NACHT domain-containing protein n=1 Tax=Zavarzinella formosa TaxID=360055 RepID=UPI0002D2A6B2|nr:hypothetical protein [Zavarzinella formosa]
MNILSDRTPVAVSCLVAMFLAALTGILVFLCAKSHFGEVVAAISGFVILIVLLLGIITIAYFYRPRAHVSSGARVLIYALGSLLSGLSIVAANQVWDLVIAVMNTAIHLANPEAKPFTPGEDNPYYFSLFCATIITISLFAYLMERPPLTLEQPKSTEKLSLPTSSAEKNRFRLWFECFLPSTAVLLAWAVLEYRSELRFASEDFADGIHSAMLSSGERIRLAAMVAMSFVGWYYFGAAMIVWYRRRESIREEYSLYASAASVTIALVVILTWALFILDHMGATPWTATRTYFDLARGHRPLPLKEDIARPIVASGLLVLGYLTLCYFFAKWNGLKSTEQHRLQQKFEKTQLLLEGIRTWWRLLSGGMLPTIYLQPPRPDPILSDPPVDPLIAWKDRARELARLRTSSYVLGEEAIWHDLKRCWVGRNRDTGKRVLLFVAHEGDKKTLTEQVSYIDELSGMAGPEIGDIIFAILKPAELEKTNWRNIAIQWNSESDLLDNLVDFSDYFHAIKQRVLYNRLPDSELTVEKVYRESLISLPNGDKENVEAYLNQWVTDPSRRQVVLLGEYGQGKSTAALMWVYNTIEKLKPGQRLPLLIELRGLSPRSLTPEELLGVWGQKYNLNPRALLRLLIAGRITLIFEGFDEMDLVGDSEMRILHCRALWNFSFERAKILFTGRPNFFFTTPELEEAMRTTRRMAGNHYGDIVELEPFDMIQVKDALRNFSLEVQKQIPERAIRNKRFSELVSRPSLLHVVATLWIDHKLYQKDPDELTSAYVMDLFIRSSYRRQGLKAAHGMYGLGLTLDELAYFMKGIAVHMSVNGLENQISFNQLRDAFENLYEAIPECVSTRPYGGEAADPLKNRIGGDELKKLGILAAVHTAGLLVSDPTAIGKFSFAHKSFMEFMVADVLTKRLLQPEEFAEAAICNATGANVLTVFKLPVAVQFLAELVAGQARSKKTGTELAFQEDIRLARQLYRSLVTPRYQPLSYFKALHFAFVSVNFARELKGDRKTNSLLNNIGERLPTVLFLLLPIHLIAQALLSGTSPTITPLTGLAVASTVAMGVYSCVRLMFVIDSQMMWERLAAWRAICRQLCISDVVLHRVTGTFVFPWLRGHPFHIFSSSNREMIRSSLVQIASRTHWATIERIPWRVIDSVLEQAEAYAIRDPASIIPSDEVDVLMKRAFGEEVN